jgi:putative DNA primase/helicase
LKTPKVRWLWPRYVRAAGLVLVTGRTGIGKSTFLARLAAQVTGGPAIGGGKPQEPQNALWLSIEDDLALEVGPKLDAAGADRARVIHPLCDAEGHAATRLRFPGDLGRLADVIREHQAKAVFIEPIDSFLADGLNVNDMAHVRGVLDPLTSMARQLSTLVVFTHHMRKDQAGHVLSRVSGSAAWSQCPSTVIALHDHAEGGELGILRVEKSRGVKQPSSWTFTLEDAGHAPLFKLLDQVAANAEELPEQQERIAERKSRAEIEAFVLAAVKNGPVQASEVLKEADRLRIHPRNIQRARSRLGIDCKQRSGGAGNDWWFIPTEAHKNGV